MDVSSGSSTVTYNKQLESSTEIKPSGAKNIAETLKEKEAETTQSNPAIFGKGKNALNQLNDNNQVLRKIFDNPISPENADHLASFINEVNPK